MELFIVSEYEDPDLDFPHSRQGIIDDTYARIEVRAVPRHRKGITDESKCGRGEVDLIGELVEVLTRRLYHFENPFRLVKNQAVKSIENSASLTDS